MAVEKAIIELPESQTTDSATYLHQSRGGVDEKILADVIIDQLTQESPYDLYPRNEAGANVFLTSSDRNAYIRCLSVVGTTVTVPADASAGWSSAVEIYIRKASEGDITVAGDVGVTINPAPGGLTLIDIGQVGKLVRVGPDEWDWVSNCGSSAEDTAFDWIPMERGLNSGSVSSSFYTVKYGDGAWVATGISGVASRSTDNGQTWNELPQGLNTGSLGGHLFVLETDGDGTWLAGSSAGYFSQSTDDGLTWSTLPEGLAFSDGTYELEGFSGVTTDGIGTWVVVGAAGGSEDVRNANVYSTDNMLTWNILPLQLGQPTSLGFKDVATDGTRWVVVGSSGRASTSTGLITWTPLIDGLNSGNTTSRFNTVEYSNGRWVAAGIDGYAATSVNGTTWTPLHQGLYTGSPNSEIKDVSSNGEGWWIAVGLEGFAAESTDNGVTWYPLEQGLNSGDPTAKLRGVVHGTGDYWMSVGSDGYAARTDTAPPP